MIHQILEDAYPKSIKLSIPFYNSLNNFISTEEIRHEIFTTAWLQNYSNLIIPIEINSIIRKFQTTFPNRPFQNDYFCTVQNLISKLMLLVEEPFMLSDQNIIKLDDYVNSLIQHPDYKFISSNINFSSSEEYNFTSGYSNAYICWNDFNLIGGKFIENPSLSNLFVIKGNLIPQSESKIHNMIKSTNLKYHSIIDSNQWGPKFMKIPKEFSKVEFPCINMLCLSNSSSIVTLFQKIATNFNLKLRNKIILMNENYAMMEAKDSLLEAYKELEEINSKYLKLKS